MNKLIRWSWVYTLVGLSVSAMLFSFSAITGAHSVQVYLDNKLEIDHYVDSKMQAPSLLLDPAKNYREVIVKYSECGRTVTGRTITIKDANDKVMKEWRFEGASSGFKDPMVCQVKDITALKQKGSNTVKLYYSSNEFPEGQQIASLVLGGEATTALK